MHIAILGGSQEKEEFFSHPLPAAVRVTVADSRRAFEAIEADAGFYLSYEKDHESVPGLSNFSKGLLFVNDVCGDVSSAVPVVRFNGWPTFLKRGIFELSLTSYALTEPVDQLFAALGWKYEIVKDVPGFVTPRVVAAMINEAYFTLGAHVSTKSEIDTAMKLGTNYPYGPFEWSELIGLKNVAALLRKLASTDERYVPAPALEIDLLLAGRNNDPRQ